MALIREATGPPNRSDCMSNVEDLTRRRFVADAGKTTLATMAAAALPLIVPRRVLGRGHRAPSDPVNVAIVGIEGVGFQKCACAT